MPISFKLEHVIEEVLSEYPKDQKRMLRRLAGVRLTSSEASSAWPQVLEHKWFLSERLGRDVGLRVAAVDYFENIQPPRPSSFFNMMEGTMPPQLPMMRSLSERFSS
ncbi:MAG TPA: DUF4032 domain-containing protein [Pyrinomonadaceae bacterium]|jgi:hypothetical protein